MAYSITFQPRPRIRGVQPTTVVKETASQAWKEVHGLMMSDEEVTINGGRLGWEELKRLAEEEQRSS